ncbi:MAG: endonuclease/exonuclease/phosphatase family protein [Luteolibacter sp.]
MCGGWKIVWLALLLVGCQRKQAEVVPKAVPVRTDGALELKLLTLNVRYEEERDLGERAWPRRIVEMVHLIRQQSPDVFGVQEALHGQAADLWASLPEYTFYGVGREDGRRAGEYAGIFFRKDRFELDAANSGIEWLSDKPEIPGTATWGNHYPRIVTWVRLIDRSSGRGFRFYNTHWDHQKQYARERSALFLAEKLDRRTPADEPVVVVGDFNAVETNPGIAYLTGKTVQLVGRQRTWENALRDTFSARHPTEKNRRTLHFWKRGTGGTLKVDYVLVSPEAKVVRAAILSQWPGMVSDHFPVSAEVVFPGRAEIK